MTRIAWPRIALLFYCVFGLAASNTFPADRDKSEKNRDQKKNEKSSKSKKNGKDESLLATLRAQVERTTGFDSKTFTELIKSDVAPKFSDQPNQSVTVILLLALGPSETKEQKREFDYGENPPKPGDMARELSRKSIGIGKKRVFPATVSLIQADRIKKITGQQAEGVLRGEIHYDVPKLFKGIFRFRAKKTDGGWEIVEYAFPAHGLETTVNDKGLWKATKVEKTTRRKKPKK